MKARSVVLSLTVLVAFAFLTESVVAQPAYTIVDFGSIGGGVFARRINDAGQAVAVGFDGAGTLRALLFEEGTLTNLGGLVEGSGASDASGINSSGQVIFPAVTSSDGTHPFIYHNGTVQDLGFDAAYLVMGINDVGEVTGRLPTNNAFLYSNGNVTDLGTVGGTGIFSHGYGINNFTQIVGDEHHIVGGAEIARAMIWQDGEMSYLPLLSGGENIHGSRGQEITDSGQIAGTSPGSGLAGSHAVYWESPSSQPIDLGTLGGAQSDALGINDSAEVVGRAQIADGTFHAFLWRNGAMTDLNQFIPDHSGWLLTSAQDINNRGEIVGNGILNGLERSFLLTPVPEPRSCVLVLLGIGIASIFVARA